jgi:hypothetical protein
LRNYRDSEIHRNVLLSKEIDQLHERINELTAGNNRIENLGAEK